ncbi:MAG: PAS domain S-box protein [Ignavibacteria bacterium]
MQSTKISSTKRDGFIEVLSENLKHYLDLTRVMFVVLDTHETVKMVNRQGCEILGYSEEEVIGKNWFETFLPGGIISEVKMAYNKMMQGKDPEEFFENPIIRKNGDERIIYWHTTILKDDKGKIVGVLSSGEDITEIRKIQIELRRHSETMETLYNLSQEISDSTDMGDLLVRIGKVISKYTAVIVGGFYLKNEDDKNFVLKATFGNKNSIDLLPESLNNSTMIVKNVLQNRMGYIDNVSYQKKGIELNSPRYSLLMKGGNETAGILSIILKDTDEYTMDFFRLIASESERGISRKITDILQKESEEKFYTVFQTSPDSIAISKIDDGVFLEINEKFVEMTGFARDEIIGKKVSQVEGWKFPQDRIRLIRELKEKGKVINFETILRKKDGEINVLMSAKVIEYNGRACMLTIVKDITDRIEAEREVLATKDMLEKITNTSPAFISLHDLKHDRTIYSNKSILKYVGYSEDEIKNIAATETKDRLYLYLEEDLPAIMESDKNVLLLKDGEVLNLEFRLKGMNGEIFWFRQSSAVFQRDEKGLPSQSVNIFEDISEKKRSDALVEKRNQEINLLYEAGKHLAGTLDLYELYDRMYDTVSKIGDCDELFVSTFDSDTKLIKYFYLKSSVTNERIDVSKIPPIPLAPSGFGILSESIRTGNSRIIDDYLESFKKVKTSYTIDQKGDLTKGETAGEEVADYKPNSCMIVPIKLDSKVFGVVQIFSRHKKAFNKEQLFFVESLLHQVALANNNVILYQKAQEEIKERKIAEESLRKSEERLRHYAQTVPDVLYQLDMVNKKYDFLSPSLEKMLGYPLQEALDNPYAFTEKVMHPDDMIKTQKALMDFINNGPTDKPFEAEARMYRKDGRMIWVRDIIRFSWTNGAIISASGIMSNISERKRAEELEKLRNEQIITQQAALFEMSKFTATELANSLRIINNLVVKTVDADRTAIWLFNEDKTQINCLDLVSVKDKHKAPGMVLKGPKYNDFFEFILSEKDNFVLCGQSFPAIEEFEKEYFNAFGTNSSIFAKIRHHGAITGFICVESLNKSTNDWTREQIDFILSTTSIIAIALESDERQKAEQETLKSLKDKELLLREIHHRVKNNLAVISSLLYLQSQKTTNKQVLDSLTESQLRVKSMVLVHEKLYRSKDLSSINYSEYIESLTSSLFRTYEFDSKRISLEMNVKEIYLDTDSASSVGLIINELISNSIKHAFPGERDGKITIDFGETGVGFYTLIVRDDGVGLPPGFDFQNTDTLGLKLVSTLVEQIDGTLEIENKKGSSFKIKFPKKT